jgi:predicted O-methyltransferase YrrM
MLEETYEFTNNWFTAPAEIWKRVLPSFSPRKFLEIGSYEGASSCFLIDTFGGESSFEIHCVDSWAGGIEHADTGEYATDMARVKERFIRNTSRALAGKGLGSALVVHEQRSDLALSHLLATGKKNYFDFIYVDGSHEAPDVICDAILGFKLLRVGGCMAFDDYLWSERLTYGRDPLRCPKLAIDSFTNLFFRKIEIMNETLTQVFVVKLSD